MNGVGAHISYTSFIWFIMKVMHSNSKMDDTYIKSEKNPTTLHREGPRICKHKICNLSLICAIMLLCFEIMVVLPN